MTDSELAMKINWAPINTKYYWSTAITSAKIGNVTLPISVNSVIYDSGASLCYFPPPEFKAITQQMQLNHKCVTLPTQDFICDCKA